MDHTMVLKNFVLIGVAFVWWLDYSPPTKANRVRFSAGSIPDFRMWESCLTLPLSASFLGDLPFPPLSHSGAASFTPHFTQISSQYILLRAAQIFHFVLICNINSRIYNSPVEVLRFVDRVQKLASRLRLPIPHKIGNERKWEGREMKDRKKNNQAKWSSKYNNQQAREGLGGTVWREEKGWVVNRFASPIAAASWSTNHLTMLSGQRERGRGEMLRRWRNVDGTRLPLKKILGRSPGEFSRPDFRLWKSCWTVSLAGEFFFAVLPFPRPFVPALLHPRLLRRTPSSRSWLGLQPMSSRDNACNIDCPPRRERSTVEMERRKTGEAGVLRENPSSKDNVRKVSSHIQTPGCGFAKTRTWTARMRDWGRNGKESAMAFVRDPSQHSPGVIAENHGKPKSGWPDPPKCETSELTLGHFARPSSRYSISVHTLANMIIARRPNCRTATTDPSAMEKSYQGRHEPPNSDEAVHRLLGKLHLSDSRAAGEQKITTPCPDTLEMYTQHYENTARQIRTLCVAVMAPCANETLAVLAILSIKHKRKRTPAHDVWPVMWAGEAGTYIMRPTGWFYTVRFLLSWRNSISETATFVNCSRASVVKVYREWTNGTIGNNRRGNRRAPRDTDVRGERRLRWCMKTNRQATVEQLTVQMNQGTSRHMSTTTVLRTIGSGLDGPSLTSHVLNCIERTDVSVSGEKRRRTDTLHTFLDEHKAVGAALCVLTWLQEYDQDIEVLPWPPNNSDLNLIEDLLDHFDRLLRLLAPPPRTHSSRYPWQPISTSLIHYQLIGAVTFSKVYIKKCSIYNEQTKHISSICAPKNLKNLVNSSVFKVSHGVWEHELFLPFVSCSFRNSLIGSARRGSNAPLITMVLPPTARRDPHVHSRCQRIRVSRMVLGDHALRAPRPRTKEEETPGRAVKGSRFHAEPHERSPLRHRAQLPSCAMLYTDKLTGR
ncbi:hypothetical protein PR048_032200 [Dryococelus australis]|uniref:Uncharacterized protein n=1 Tax=Dryococelus australis TaxID=614101 RepID=A0ABQ9G2R3_9NEOP|nr:hypothetical protein PR048_032200 [Dryococelus australis]